MHKSKIYSICLGVLLFLIGFNSYGKNPQQVITKYLDQLGKAMEQLDAGSLKSRKKIDIRNRQLFGAGYWNNVKKRPGIAVGPISFFQRHKPLQWKIVSSSSAAATGISVLVNFKLSSYPDHLWKTRFDMVQINNKWLIEQFVDITRRPVAEDANIETILDTYLKEVSAVVKRQFTEKLTNKEKQAINMNYMFGAGYWLGHSSNKDVPAGKAYMFLLSWKPDTWNISTAKIAGDYAETKVVFKRTSKRGRQSAAQVTFEFSRLSNGWFMAGYRPDKKIPVATQPKHQASLSLLNNDQSSPEALVRSQFDIIQKLSTEQSANVMGKLAEYSKPLWVDNRQAKRGMGRILGMSMSFISKKQPVNWKIAAAEFNADDVATIVATPGIPLLKMFKEIRFSAKRVDGKWFLTDALMLR